jgi:uridine kinase
MSRATAPHVIAIAGPSGSGKTSLAREIAARLPGGGLVFGLDSYYRDQRNVPEDTINVDVPEALDHPRIVMDLRELAAGRHVRQPVYDYATHARLATDRAVEPAPFIVVEGLYALFWADVRELIRTAVFVALDHEECLRRRLDRDTRERGRTAHAVTSLYERNVRPMYDLHVQPTHHYADLILDGRLSLGELTRQVLLFLLPDRTRRPSTDDDVGDQQG